ncbi:MAG: hypothetical protein KC609_07400 [Myxococcales bacterium]|nr:hypothetical protein [Myxococcales bacterium]
MNGTLFYVVGTIYLAAGLVTLVIYLRASDLDRRRTLINAPVVLLFWPLSLQALLARPDAEGAAPERRVSPEVAERLRQIASASAECPGWIADLVARQLPSIRQVSEEVADWQQRLAELERLLQQPAFDEQLVRERWQGLEDPAGDGAACLQNIGELQRLRGEYRQRIDRFHLRLERVGSQLTVLRFCDASSESAEAEIEQLINLVDSLRETRNLTETATEPNAEGDR